MVVVEAEHEPHVLDACFALGGDEDRRRRPPARPGRARAGPPTAIVARSSPSRTSRVASPAWRPERRSEYGPRGRAGPGRGVAAPGRSCSRGRRRQRMPSETAHAGKHFPSKDGLFSRRCCAGSRRGCPCGAASGSSGSSSSAFEPGPETTVVDVGVTDAPFGGGSSDNFFEALLPVAAADHRRRASPSSTAFAPRSPAVRAVRADGRELPFGDGEFDLAFSNAVVEHVGGGREGQRRFVHELCRVARRVFVTTPNSRFPLEVHSLVPFAHWLPRGRATGSCGRAASTTCSSRCPRESSPSLFPVSRARPEPRDDADRDRAR